MDVVVVAVVPFWYRLTQVVLDNGPLNVRACVRVMECFIVVCSQLLVEIFNCVVKGSSLVLAS